MLNAVINVPDPKNEPIKTYAPGTPERDELKKQIEAQRDAQIERMEAQLRDARVERVRLLAVRWVLE